MKIVPKVALVLFAAGLASGCGSSGKPDTAMTPPASADAFTQTVQVMAATASDTAAAIDIDAIAATVADNALPVGF